MIREKSSLSKSLIPNGKGIFQTNSISTPIHGPFLNIHKGSQENSDPEITSKIQSKGFNSHIIIQTKGSHALHQAQFQLQDFNQSFFILL